MTITSRVKFVFYNILEEGTVAVTAVDAGYPKERLHDRSLGFYCMYSSAGAYVVSVSGNSLPIDTLIVEGHALNGVACTWDWSDNGSAWTTALSWTQSGNGQIVKSLTSALTHAYWRLSMGSHAFQATEIFMGRAISLPVIWSDEPRFSDVENVEWLETYGGITHAIRIGSKRKIRAYTVFMDRVDFPIATFRSDIQYLDDYSKPFYFIDHEEICFLSKFQSGLIEESHLNEGILLNDFSVVEIF